MNMKSRNGAVVAAAAAFAIGAAGLYAGVLSTTTAGKTGAGSTAVQASCATAAVITPGVSTWNSTSKKFEYDTLLVSYTSGSGCEDQYATTNVYSTSTGSELTKNTTPHQITVGEDATSSFVVTLDDGVDAGMDETGFNYGLVIQSAT